MTSWGYLASMKNCNQWDELFISVSYHPSAYQTDIHSSAFMPSQWTVVLSFHLPGSRSMAVLLIEYSIQSEPFHISHSFFFLRTNFYSPNLHSIYFPDLPTIPALRMASYRGRPEFDSRQCVWDLWRKEWHGARVHFCIFLRRLSFHKYWTLALSSVIQLCHHK